VQPFAHIADACPQHRAIQDQRHPQPAHDKETPQFCALSMIVCKRQHRQGLGSPHLPL
jgi:hypothetical protein